MLSSIFLIYKAAQLLCRCIAWCVLGFVKWFMLTLLWLISPQQALETMDELEADNAHEQS